MVAAAVVGAAVAGAVVGAGTVVAAGPQALRTAIPAAAPAAVLRNSLLDKRLLNIFSS
jgi:hypothetical protein